MTNTVYLTTNKLIDNLPNYFSEDNIKQAQYVFLYFDKVIES